MTMKKILLIEDNDDIRSNTAEILELANYKVIQAKNGKEGVALAIANSPDLVICDIMMPELDGFGVLHAIHKNEAIKNTPFIFLTAKSDRSDFRKGMEQGADDYITKPFDGTELLNAIDSRFRKIDLLKQELPASAERLYASNDHMGNFFDCVRSRKAPVCEVEIGHRSVSVCHLGVLALRLGRKLKWDPAKEEFVGDKDANKWVAREQRKPWTYDMVGG